MNGEETIDYNPIVSQHILYNVLSEYNTTGGLGTEPKITVINLQLPAFITKPKLMDSEELTESAIQDVPVKPKRKPRGIKKDAVDFSEKLAKRGVIYLSRIPPFMKPNKVRIMFEEYGEVTRLYLAEEDSSRRKKRQQSGGNGSKQFAEGWVEFADKSLAKQVALSLNNTPIGGKKRNFYHDDIWNIKYLKNFKWDFLTEKFAYERRVRENKLKTSMQQSKRQNAEYIEMLDKQKTEQFIRDRKRKRAENNEDNNIPTTINSDENSTPKINRKFKQVQSIGRMHGENDAKPNISTLKEVFSK
eukprot:gene7768-15897_t